MTEQRTLEPGTEVFDADGRRAVVALDRRAKGGKLWANSGYTRRNYRTGKDEETRHELHGLWIPVEGNEGLATFCGQVQRAAIAPLKEQIDELNRRVAVIRAFATLTARAATGEEVSDGFVARMLSGCMQRFAYLHEMERVRDRLGGPTEGRYDAFYSARFKKNAGGPVIVYGSKGEVEIAPPPELIEAAEKGES